MGGKTKLDIAKETFSALVDELPPDVNAGLIVYGNRVEKSCEIIDVTVPVKKLDAGAMKNAMKTLKMYYLYS